ncbi:trypco2 family protein [Saccharothrix luteola]|uniref:trypco2 family protein n=1 Tax=Saccharothrix luteola TaxID=2893018 RepID=UPI001E2FCA95|nr:trypco2 family protein [Saccharothrix luteola]MCC8247088.1 hypothetical protein [Saccharothrix luteola]MCC8249871.1 hypothetical protein [Saccharothrix luteola]
MTNRVGIAEAIDGLREELGLAQDAGADHQFRFEVTEVEVELLVEVRKEAKAGAKVQFGVVSVNSDGKAASARTHRIKLRLSATDAATGRNLEVSRDVERPWTS